MTRDESIAMAAKKMSEKVLLANVAKMARLHGWMFYHTHRSQFSEAGYPDCSMLRSGVHIVAELKRQKEHATLAQERWLFEFAKTGALAYVWKPMDWIDGTIEKVLRDTER